MKSEPESVVHNQALGPVVQKPVNVNPGLVEILWPKL